MGHGTHLEDNALGETRRGPTCRTGAVKPMPELSGWRHAGEAWSPLGATSSNFDEEVYGEASRTSQEIRGCLGPGVHGTECRGARRDALGCSEQFIH